MRAVKSCRVAARYLKDTAAPAVCKKVLECGGKRNATPLWISAHESQSGVTAAALQSVSVRCFAV
jgi:hypothetical protein